MGIGEWLESVALPLASQISWGVKGASGEDWENVNRKGEWGCIEEAAIGAARWHQSKEQKSTGFELRG